MKRRFTGLRRPRKPLLQTTAKTTSSWPLARVGLTLTWTSGYMYSMLFCGMLTSCANRTAAICKNSDRRGTTCIRDSNGRIRNTINLCFELQARYRQRSSRQSQQHRGSFGTRTRGYSNCTIRSASDRANMPEGGSPYS